MRLYNQSISTASRHQHCNWHARPDLNDSYSTPLATFIASGSYDNGYQKSRKPAQVAIDKPALSIPSFAEDTFIMNSSGS